MKKDIAIPEVSGVHLLALREPHEEMENPVWNIYLWNKGATDLETVIVVLRGASDDKKTSVMRRTLQKLEPGSYAKLEFLPDELLHFRNEYLVTFFMGNTMYEKDFVLEPGDISEEKIASVSLPGIQGILFD